MSNEDLDINLDLLIVEEELRRAEEELKKLQGLIPPVEVPRELMESEWLEHRPANNGPEYLTVHCSMWTNEICVDGENVRSLENARTIARDRGLKGISIQMGVEN